MLQNIHNSKIKIIQIVFLIGLFGLIRAFENQLFYDPFLNYFKTETPANYPKFDWLALLWSLFFRYALNALISLGLLYILFNDMDLVRFSGLLFAVFFAILLVLFSVVLFYFDESQKMILFYVRRFLIQPIFILLFIPGFYFQKVTMFENKK
jgi:exosortase F-associated protein